MKLSDFDYQLPKQLIAQYPKQQRTTSRLLQVADQQFNDLTFTDLPDLLVAGDCLVFNNTKVLPARVYGKKATGGLVECLFERLISANSALMHIRASKAPKAGSEILFEDGAKLMVEGKQGNLYCCQLISELDFIPWLNQQGHMPLPPYIERDDQVDDWQRYQTVYAEQEGAVAAPTAGLHFDQALLDRLQLKGIHLAYLTLHVGSGTFQPVRVDDITQHQMHTEYYDLPQSTVDVIKKTKADGGRVIAVGTTSVRCLETVASRGELAPSSGETDIFIYPGYQFKIIDAMITNFHLPQSTLLMLVSAFAGVETIKNAYQHAISQQYRFFSYGDAMWLERAS